MSGNKEGGKGEFREKKEEGKSGKKEERGSWPVEDISRPMAGRGHYVT